ncbi:Gfo/Idh/MocA family oxidoreductase [Parapedobacter indicus]|uniref:Predicted dehydrogenase n=1 Tax=Parapedobacter indicus TaxID=1477437 RepID=A0A1I3GU20_9SPHI|nr:Gfo/Idh/MocA family oxidoreductase [Parapedobacter indicus]PPL02778.1 putative dehydrogenase [Parapedobacter indicus]SFI26802.1 Predicted dehydrogenase [Parapedobacter indicus]
MIRIGIIGLSEGNAHPYSWSSIINGRFDGAEINRLGYPAVTAYLEANRDTLGIPDAAVTHVWCQKRIVSESIAQSSGITTVVEQLDEMVGQVDAVILGRDDPENHVAMAKPFIEAKIPIFIDKPLAYSREDLEWFAGHARKGRFIMSCSSMRYANECRVAKQELANLGNIELVTAVGKKDWKKYGIHLLEAVFTVMEDLKPLSVQHIGALDREIVHVQTVRGPDVMLHLFNSISGTFQLSFFGTNNWKLVDIRNSYSMFRDNLIEFVRSVQEGKARLPFEDTYRLINVILAANESRLENGKRISLS